MNWIGIELEGLARDGLRLELELALIDSDSDLGAANKSSD